MMKAAPIFIANQRFMTIFAENYNDKGVKTGPNDIHAIVNWELANAFKNYDQEKEIGRLERISHNVNTIIAMNMAVIAGRLAIMKIGNSEDLEIVDSKLPMVWMSNQRALDDCMSAFTSKCKCSESQCSESKLVKDADYAVDLLFKTILENRLAIVNEFSPAPDICVIREVSEEEADEIAETSHAYWSEVISILETFASVISDQRLADSIVKFCEENNNS
jgi:hypothetical protein